MFVSDSIGADNRFDAVLVGAGIMSSTLAVLLHELEPEMRILIVERLDSPALESSAALNNAGTGHAANCELNYTPVQADGTIDLTKALKINTSFERSLEFWASLTANEKLHPNAFLHQAILSSPRHSMLAKIFKENLDKRKKEMGIDENTG